MEDLYISLSCTRIDIRVNATCMVLVNFRKNTQVFPTLMVTPVGHVADNGVCPLLVITSDD